MKPPTLQRPENGVLGLNTHGVNGDTFVETGSPTLIPELAKSPSRLVTTKLLNIVTSVAVAKETVSKVAPPENVIAPLIIGSACAC